MKTLLLITFVLQTAAKAQEVGEACEGDTDCVSNSCWTAFAGTNGTCVCNPETGAGCAANQSCTFPEGLYDGFPRCTSPVGAECTQHDDCITSRCFVGESSTGICACTASSGCLDGQICSEAEVPLDGEPRCAVPVGGNCTENDECESRLCYTNFLLPQGICICSIETNIGCPEGQTCSINRQVADVPPACRFGPSCASHDDCETENCHVGSCVCNVETNRGCNNNTQICTGDFLSGYQCHNKTNSIGGNCTQNTECETEFCFDGTCQCNPSTGAGCDANNNELCVGDGVEYSCRPEEPEIQVTVEPTTSPSQEPTKKEANADPNNGIVEVGGACTTNENCETQFCFDGTCQCNPSNGAGCDANNNELCVGDGVEYSCRPEEPEIQVTVEPTLSPSERSTGNFDPVETQLPTPEPTTASSTTESGPSIGGTAAPSPALDNRFPSESTSSPTAFSGGATQSSLCTYLLLWVLLALVRIPGV